VAVYLRAHVVDVALEQDGRGPALDPFALAEEDPQEVGDIAVAVADPIGGLADRESLVVGPFVDEGGEDGGARRRRGLGLHRPASDGRAPKELDDGGRRDRDEAVAALDEAAPQLYPRGEDLVGLEIVEAYRRADDVHDGIHRADLVKKDVLDALGVHLRLGLRQLCEHGEGLLLDRKRERAALDEGADILVGAMAMARGGPRRARESSVSRRGKQEIDVGASAVDALFRVRRKAQGPAIEAELRELGAERLGRHAQIDHRGEVHVPADAGEAVVVEDALFHASTPLRAMTRFMLPMA
jgi:hypothetical protein